MTHDESGIGRRKLLEHGAMAAGLAWSAPVVRSVGRFATVGTPAPTSSSSSVPPTTTYILSGSFTGAESVVSGSTLTFTPFAIELSTPFGPSTFSLVIAFESSPEAAVFVGGGYSILSASGSIFGTVSGGSAVLTDAVSLHAELTVDGGTGLFTSATGNINIDGGIDAVGAFGTVSGTVEVPA